MKAGLDLEIGMFRCLVVSEEERLGLIPGVFQYQHRYIVDGVFCIWYLRLRNGLFDIVDVVFCIVLGVFF